MNTKVNKTIMNFQIKSFEFYKQFNWRLKREAITGHIWLSDDKRIRVEGNDFFLINKAGEKEGIVLKSNPGYKRIKRIVARYFSSYRKGKKGGVGHHAGYWRSRAIDGQHNCNLFRHSLISFKENKSNFIRLAS